MSTRNEPTQQNPAPSAGTLATSTVATSTVATSTLPSSALRAVARVAMLLCAVAVLLPVCGTPILLASLAGSRARFNVVMALTPFFCRVMAACLGLRVDVRGRRDPGALVFVGNHVSYLDIIVAGVAVGGVFVSRHDVKDWPLIGVFARLAGTVLLDRSSLRSAVASAAGLVERASQGIRIALFPEGRTSSGDTIGDFKPFLFSAVAASGFVVQPFAIRYRSIGAVPIDESNRDLVYWYDPAPALDTHGWRLLKLRNIRVTVTFLDARRPPAEPDKNAVRDYAEALRADIVEAMRRTGEP